MAQPCSSGTTSALTFHARTHTGLPADICDHRDARTGHSPSDSASRTSKPHLFPPSPPASFLTLRDWAAEEAGKLAIRDQSAAPSYLSLFSSTVSSVSAWWSSEHPSSLPQGTLPRTQTRGRQAALKSTYLLKWRAWVTPGSCRGHWCYPAQFPLGCASQGAY